MRLPSPLPLGQTDQRETGLGIPSGPISRQQGFLGAVDVAFAQSDSSELAQWPSQFASQVRAQFLAGQERLALGLIAQPAQPEDLGAVDPAAPVQAPDRVRVGPPLHRLGPFLSQVVLREALQRTHELE